MTLRVVMGFFGVFFVAILWKVTDKSATAPQLKAPTSKEST